jgi:transcription initiation factor TFIIIB Brf1 subunit/transcription initiation factor TFIIB
MKRSGGSKRIIRSLSGEREEKKEAPASLDEMWKAAERASSLLQDKEESLARMSPSSTERRVFTSDVQDDQEDEDENMESYMEDEDDGNEDDRKTAQDHVRCQFRKNVEKGIKTDLSKLGIAPEVIEIADRYYFEVTKGEIKRSNLRKGIMFACVFQAYKDIGRPQTPDYLQNLFKITRRTMSKGLTYFYPRSTKRSGDNGYITAEHFIPRVMETFNAKQEYVQAALKLYEKVKDKTTLFNSSNPQSVSCGFVYYYLKKLYTETKSQDKKKMIDFDLTAKDFGKVVGLSEVTITRIANRIEEILTS